MPGVPPSARTNARGCRATSSPASSSSPCSFRRAWRTRSWRACRRSPGSTRRSSACVAYALVGPSPILVLGPDSSLGPMIAAAVLPLAAGQPGAGHRAGRDARAPRRGRDRVAAGLGQARLRRRPPVEPGADRLPGRPGGGDLRRPAAEAVRHLDRRRWPPRRGGRVRPGCRAWPDQPVGAGHRPAEPRHHPRPQARWRRGRRASWSRSSSAIALSIVLDLAAHGGGGRSASCRRASPCRRFPAVELADLPLLFAAALGISLVAIGDTISTSGGFAARSGYEVDGNQELAGIGSANLAAGFFTGFPVSTSGSRTAVAFQSGAKTQLTGLVAAALVLADAAVRARPGAAHAPAGAGGRRHRGVDQPVRRRARCAGSTRPPIRVRAGGGMRPRRGLRRRAGGHRARRASCRSSTSSSARGRPIRRSWASPRRRPATTTSRAIRTPSR